MRAQLKPQPITSQQYYEMAQASPVKLEFLRGQVVQWDAMAGSTPNHARISANIIAVMHTLLRGRNCYVTSSDQLVRCEANDENSYPNATVVCPPEVFSTEQPLALLNPSAVFEVLSPSTAEKDLTTKSDTYFRIESLRFYLIVSQDQIRVEVRARGAASWETRVYNRPEDEIELPALGIRLPVGEIYDGLSLPSLSLLSPRV